MAPTTVLQVPSQVSPRSVDRAAAPRILSVFAFWCLYGRNLKDQGTLVGGKQEPPGSTDLSAKDKAATGGGG